MPHPRRPLLAGAACVALALGGALQAQAGPVDLTGFAAAGDIHAQIEAMGRKMKAGQGFLWEPLVRSDATVAGLEYWKAPGRPAVHPSEIEYTIVVEGSGTLVSGGTMLDAKVSKPGLTEGSRIEGGSTRSLAPGDVIMIPAGMPHWFGITGDHLVLLGIKLPVR